MMTETPMAKTADDVKKQAHQLIDQLPEEATWEDVAYRAAVRASIERGLADVAAGRVMTTQELRESLGLTE